MIDVKEYYGLYTDTWKMFHQFADRLPETRAEQAGQFWSDLDRAANDIFSRHQQSQLAHDLLLNTVDELERLSQLTD